MSPAQHEPGSGATPRTGGLRLLASIAALGLMNLLLPGGSRDESRTRPGSARNAPTDRQSGDADDKGVSTRDDNSGEGGGDRAPGDQDDHKDDVAKSVRNYLIGLGLAGLLTAGSFALSGTDLVWGPAVPAALIVFAIAQMGVHLVFFLHLTTAPDNINNAMALAFGVLIVLLLIGGSTWIMFHMNHNMMLMPHSMPMSDASSG